MMVIDEDTGKVADPQPTSVEEGGSVMVAVMPVDDKDKAMEAGEKLTVALMATGSGRFGGLHVDRVVHHRDGRRDEQCPRNRGAGDGR